MIYLEETFDLMPASPETRDAFVAFAQEQLIPCSQRLGARLVAAWFCDADLFGQVMHVLEFDDLAALGSFRAQSAADAEWAACKARLEELAPAWRSRLMEALGPIPAEATRAAAAESQTTPRGAYSMAILQVSPGKMPQFIAALEASAKALPIIASWRTIVGTQDEITDVWKGALGQAGYSPAAEGMKQWFRDLRELAPRERLRVVYPLPYSPLQ